MRIPRNSERSLSFVVNKGSFAGGFLKHQQITARRGRRTVKGFADADVQLLLRGTEWDEDLMIN